MVEMWKTHSIFVFVHLQYGCYLIAICKDHSKIAKTASEFGALLSERRYLEQDRHQY